MTDSFGDSEDQTVYIILLMQLRAIHRFYRSHGKKKNIYKNTVVRNHRVDHDACYQNPIHRCFFEGGKKENDTARETAILIIIVILLRQKLYRVVIRSNLIRTLVPFFRKLSKYSSFDFPQRLL